MHRILALAFLALVSGSVGGLASAQVGKLMSFSAFRDAFIDVLRAEDPAIKAVPDPNDPGAIHVKQPSGEEFVAYLENSYATYKDAPDQLEPILHRLAELS